MNKIRAVEDIKLALIHNTNIVLSTCLFFQINIDLVRRISSIWFITSDDFHNTFKISWRQFLDQSLKLLFLSKSHQSVRFEDGVTDFRKD